MLYFYFILMHESLLGEGFISGEQCYGCPGSPAVSLGQVRGGSLLWARLAQDQQQSGAVQAGRKIQHRLPEEKLEFGLKQANPQEGGQPWGLTNPCSVLPGCWRVPGACCQGVFSVPNLSQALAGLGSETSFPCYQPGQVSC